MHPTQPPAVKWKDQEAKLDESFELLLAAVKTDPGSELSRGALAEIARALRGLVRDFYKIQVERLNTMEADIRGVHQDHTIRFDMQLDDLERFRADTRGRLTKLEENSHSPVDVTAKIAELEYELGVIKIELTKAKNDAVIDSIRNIRPPWERGAAPPLSDDGIKKMLDGLHERIKVLEVFSDSNEGTREVNKFLAGIHTGIVGLIEFPGAEVAAGKTPEWVTGYCVALMRVAQILKVSQIALAEV